MPYFFSSIFKLYYAAAHFHAPLTPCRKRRSHVCSHVFGMCALTIVAVMVCLAYCKIDRIDVPAPSSKYHVASSFAQSSFAKALTKNSWSSKPLLMPPKLMNVHATNAMFCSAHNFPTAPSNLVRSCLPTGSTRIRPMPGGLSHHINDSQKC